MTDTAMNPPVNVDGTTRRVIVTHYKLSLEVVVPVSPSSGRATYGTSSRTQVTADSLEDVCRQLLAYRGQILRFYGLDVEKEQAKPYLGAAAIWVEYLSPLDEHGRPVKHGDARIFEWKADYPCSLERALVDFAAKAAARG